MMSAQGTESPVQGACAPSLRCPFLMLPFPCLRPRRSGSHALNCKSKNQGKPFLLQPTMVLSRIDTILLGSQEVSTLMKGEHTPEEGRHCGGRSRGRLTDGGEEDDVTWNTRACPHMTPQQPYPGCSKQFGEQKHTFSIPCVHVNRGSAEGRLVDVINSDVH